MKRALGWLFVASVFCGSSNGNVAANFTDTSNAPLAAQFAQQVDMRLDVPQSEQLGYATRLDAALSSAGHSDLGPQYVVLVDRSPMVQVVFIYWRSPEREWHFVGASPASTGRPGTFDHFVTPLGVFEHTPDNMDFRAEGTKNVLGIRGYGAHGMRVYDFGWVMGERGWGSGGNSEMRLQMHATDPVLLEPQLGQTHSKGCIRIPASLNVFIDRHALLDAEYERAAAGGRHLWVLLPARKPTDWPGKYLVVVDSERGVRPAWTRWVRERRPAASPAKRGVRDATAAC
ncbi:MAG: hypothetical protein ACXWI0_27970 [Burkholderiales bacterium]